MAPPYRGDRLHNTLFGLWVILLGLPLEGLPHACEANALNVLALDLTMDLILWRHAEAEDGMPDSARELTKRGRKQAVQIGAWLKERLPADCAILVSPSMRTQQTADAL